MALSSKKKISPLIKFRDAPITTFKTFLEGTALFHLRVILKLL